MMQVDKFARPLDVVGYELWRLGRFERGLGLVSFVKATQLFSKLRSKEKHRDRNRQNGGLRSPV